MKIFSKNIDGGRVLWLTIFLEWVCAMKLEKIKEKDSKKTFIIIFTVCCILLLAGVILYNSFAVFTEEVEAERPLLLVSMVEDVKQMGGSGYVVEKDAQVLDEYFTAE